jgi:hypothetical protein
MLFFMKEGDFTIVIDVFLLRTHDFRTPQYKPLF